MSSNLVVDGDDLAAYFKSQIRALEMKIFAAQCEANNRAAANIDRKAKENANGIGSACPVARLERACG